MGERIRQNLGEKREWGRQVCESAHKQITTSFSERKKGDRRQSEALLVHVTDRHNAYCVQGTKPDTRGNAKVSTQIHSQHPVR